MVFELLDAALNECVTPFGTPETEKVTLPEKPSTSLTATVLLAGEPPTSKVTLLDGKLKLNPGAVFAAAGDASHRPTETASRTPCQNDWRDKGFPWGWIDEGISVFLLRKFEVGSVPATFSPLLYRWLVP